MKREERRELEKIDTNSQKPGNQLLHLWREKKAHCGHIQDIQEHLQKHKWKETRKTATTSPPASIWEGKSLYLKIIIKAKSHCNSGVSMWVNECLCICVCVCQLYVKGFAWIVYSDGGRRPQPHPLQRLGANRKGPKTWVTSNPHEVWKRETRQPITRKPCSSSADGRGRPQVQLPQPWSEGAREPGDDVPGPITRPKAQRAQGPHLISSFNLFAFAAFKVGPPSLVIFVW